MKKVLSLLIAAMFVVSCSISAFAVTSSGDEAEKTVLSIEITKAPTKTSYQLFVDAGWDLSGLENIPEDIDLEQLLEMINKAPFTIDADLTGAEITATYNDGTKGLVDLEDCTTSVADPVLIDDLMNESDEDVVKAMLIRDYTINVKYKGATASYKVSVGEPDFDFGDEYEVVSYKLPNKLVYDYNNDTTKEYYDDEDKSAGYDTVVNVDLTGMEMVLKNKTTNEIVTVTSENIECEPVYIEEGKLGGRFEVTAYASVYNDNEEYLGGAECTFPIDVAYLIPPATSKGDYSPSDTTTGDSANTNNTTISTDNSAVQTGNAATAGVFAVIMMSAAVIAYFCVKRKISK